MQSLKDEIKPLKEEPVPVDYTADQIQEWLNNLKTNPDDKAIQLLIERIDVKNKTEFSATSTLKSVLCEIGTLHQKRYFAFLCYRGHFLLHKPGVKMMSRGLFHFSGNLIEYY